MILLIPTGVMCTMGQGTCSPVLEEMARNPSVDSPWAGEDHRRCLKHSGKHSILPLRTSWTLLLSMSWMTVMMNQTILWHMTQKCPTVLPWLIRAGVRNGTGVVQIKDAVGSDTMTPITATRSSTYLLHTIT